MDLNEFRSLPVNMPKQELKKHFVRLLRYIEETPVFNKMDVLEALSELTDRQVYTYELLSLDLREKIDKLIMKLWDSKSSIVADIISFIVVNLALKNSYGMMKSLLLNSNLDSEVKSIIAETVNEVGDNLERPYIDN